MKPSKEEERRIAEDRELDRLICATYSEPVNHFARVLREQAYNAMNPSEWETSRDRRHNRFR